MTGTPGNANIWDGADVLVSFNLDADVPATVEEAFSADWDAVGLLNGEDGFTESRDEDVSDHFAWGGLTIRTGRRNFKLTRTFTARETNDVTDRLRWPGSSPTQLVVPRVERVKVAFETRDGAFVRRAISTRYAEIVPDGDLTENESDVSEIAFMVTVFPSTDGTLFERMETSAGLQLDVLLRANQLDLGSYTLGDPVPNEGTAGSAYDGIPRGDDLPVLVDDDGLGFELGGVQGVPPHLYVEDGPVIDVETFTAFTKVVWTGESTVNFDNFFAKIDGGLGGGGNGWQMASLVAYGGAVALAAHGGMTPGTELAVAIPDPAAQLVQGEEYIATLRIDRPGNSIDTFLNGVHIGTGTLTGLTTVLVDHEWIFGRGEHESLWRAGGFIGEALTADQIATGIPALLA